jgi:uncharacterized RDD family membrane protein YckC
MQEKYPLLTERIQSTLIDTVLIILSMFLFSNILDKIQDPPDWLRIVLFVSIWLIYEPLCTSVGFTMGNYIKGIRVRKADNVEKKINIFQGLIRYIIKVLLGWVSFLTISSNPKRRAIHDLVSGSVMIKL